MTVLKKTAAGICSLRFWGIVTAFVLISFLADAQGIDSDTSLIYLLMHYDRQQIAAMGENMSAGSIILRLRDFKWFVVLFPVLVTFCGGMDYQSHMVNGYKRLGLPRGSRKSYVFANMMTPVLLSAATLTIGYLIFTLTVLVFFPDAAMCAGNAAGSSGEFSVLAFFVRLFGESPGTWGIRYAAMYGNLFIMTILFMLLVIILLELCGDMFFSVSVPMVLNYTGYMLLNYHLAKLIEQYGFDYPPEELRMEMLNPVYAIDADYQFSNLFQKPYPCYIGIMAVFLTVLFIILFQWICHRVKYCEIK